MGEGAITGYELWDTQSRNLLEDFDTEAEAQEAVRSLIALNGSGGVDALALTQVDVNGRMATLATGPDLAARAETAGTDRGRRHS